MLGVSTRTLHRWISEGILIEGLHFRRGLTATSPFRWDTEAAEKAIRDFRQLPVKPDPSV